MAEKRMKTVVAIDIGWYDCSIDLLAITIMTAVRAAASELGKSIGAQVQLRAAYYWSRDRRCMYHFLQAVSAKLDLHLYLHAGEPPRDEIVQQNRQDDIQSLHGILQVRPGIVVTEDMLRFASNSKEIAFITGCDIVSLLGGKTEVKDLEVRIDDCAHYTYWVGRLPADAECGPPAVLAERALVINPNIAGNPDADVSLIDTRDGCLFSGSEFFRKKAPIAAGHVGYTDSVAIADVSPAHAELPRLVYDSAGAGREDAADRSYRALPRPLDVVAEGFDLRDLEHARKSHGLPGLGTRRFVLNWLQELGETSDCAENLYHIVDVFGEFLIP